MLKSIILSFAAVVFTTGAITSTHAANHHLKSLSTPVAPSTRGEANTTWFGWDSFGAISDPIDDTTPDIGTTTTGVRFRTVTGGDHTSGSGNYYSYSDTPDEEITIISSGIPGAVGKTTVIMQMVTLFGGFPAEWRVGSINGVKPAAVIQGTNAAGRGQLWAVWELPGNAETYVVKLEGTPGVSAYSFDKVEIDTWYDAGGASHPDSMVLALPANFTLNKEGTHVIPTTRGSLNTTHFGWDSFEDPATYAVPGTALADDTPDIADFSTPAGVKFESLHSNKNRASSGNYYSGSSTAMAVVNEKVTVVTRGTPGLAGKTTIIAQLVGTGAFPSAWTFGEINGVAPQVVAGLNSANRGQVWARWELPGNALSYEFTLGSVSHPSLGQAHMSFDKIEIDTWYDAAGGSHPDSMILSEPAAIAHIMDQTSGPVVPSSRGGRGTTYFGWDTFGNAGPAAVINDNSPDIGSDTTGLARFQTMNGEIHQLAGGGNLYLLSFVPGANLTLDEQITVPTNGVPGSEGFTTIILQLSSASSGQGGTTFANDIFISPINGVQPTVVQASGAASAMLWAKWVIPGNQATYTIDIDGVTNQQHYSFDQVVVDTQYSRYEGVGDTMTAKTIAITTDSLADAMKGMSYSVQLEADGGSAPHTWAVKAGSVPPAGLTLSGGGLLSGTPTALGMATFTVEVTENGGFKDEKVFSLTVQSNLEIFTSATLPTAVVGRAYQVQLAAAQGVAPYEWEIKDGTLPAGLTFSGAGLISGTPTAAGDVTLTLAVTDGEGAVVEKAFMLPVSGTLLAPVMNPLALPMTAAGAEFTHALSALNYPSSFQISGLPKGLKLTANTGVISGRVPLAGVYPIQVRALNMAGFSPWVSGALVVKAIAVMQQGTFTAWSARHAVNGSLGSLLTLKTTATGAFTLSARTGARTVSARGFLSASGPQVQIPSFAGGALSLTIHPVSGELSGSHGGAAVSGWRAVWVKNLNPASGRTGYYSLALELDASHDADTTLPRGIGYATFTVPDNGLLRIAGKTADGQNLLSSGPMGPKGEIAIYAPQYGNKGSLLGQLELSEDSSGVFSDNHVSSVELTWQKPQTTGRAHAAAFGPLTLNAAGGYLAQSARGQTVLGLPELGEFALEFREGGIGASATVADVGGIIWTEKFTAVMPATGNAARASVKINKSTGAVSGSFTLVETTPPLTRNNVTFAGQVVRGMADAEVLAVGHFLLPQIPGGGQTIRNSPLLSGAVIAVQPAP